MCGTDPHRNTPEEDDGLVRVPIDGDDVLRVLGAQFGYDEVADFKRVKIRAFDNIDCFHLAPPAKAGVRPPLPSRELPTKVRIPITLLG